MALIVRKAKTRLTFREDKPEVHVMRRLIYPKVTGKQLVQYASNAAGIPPATMQACIEAIVQAIYYYAIRGMRVTFPEFGGFYLQVRSKTAKTKMVSLPIRSPTRVLRSSRWATCANSSPTPTWLCRLLSIATKRRERRLNHKKERSLLWQAVQQQHS